MDNDSKREDCECDSNYGTLSRAFMRQYFYQGLFLRFYVSHGKSFLPSSRAHSLKIKEKTPDPRLGYLTLYLGIVACPQGLSRFSKKYWGETVFRDTQREKTIVTGIPKSVVLDTLEPPIP